MAFSTTVKVTDSSALTESERIVASLQLDRLNPRIGAAEKLLFQKHFIGLPSNKSGFPTTNLYAQFAKSTNFQPNSDGVTISVNHVAARQRFAGGTITPKKKYLTIPATAAAYGHRAGKFNNLRFAIIQGRPALVEAQATSVKFGRKKKDGSQTVSSSQSSTGLTPFFWLVRKVTQKPDRSILPSDEQIGKTAIDAVKAAIAGGNS